MPTIAETAYQRLQKLPVPLQQEVLAFIDTLDKNNKQPLYSAEKDSTQRLQQIMRTLAKEQIFAEIDDPVEWQKNIRQDKALPW